MIDLYCIEHIDAPYKIAAMQITIPQRKCELIVVETEIVDGKKRYNYKFHWSNNIPAAP